MAKTQMAQVEKVVLMVGVEEEVVVEAVELLVTVVMQPKQVLVVVVAGPFLEAHKVMVATAARAVSMSFLPFLLMQECRVVKEVVEVEAARMQLLVLVVLEALVSLPLNLAWVMEQAEQE
tara:strand:+ start:251 stop:610 length:360 start_codon:yes stop_codon:yes gene_type:complete